MANRRILILGQGNAQSRFVAVSCDFQNFINRNMEGFEIITFGYNEGVDILIKPEDDFRKVIRSLPECWVPDFCLLWQAEWNLLPSGIESAPFPLVAYISDWDYDIPITRTIIESADLTIVEGDFDKNALLEMGANNVGNFYVLGVMKEFIDSAPEKLKNREYDIFYTVMVNNNWYGDKSRFIIDLCSLPDKYKILIRKPIGSYNDYISLLRGSKLVLSHVRRGLMSIRTLEAGAQGTVCLNTGTEVKKYFSPEEEYIPVSCDNFTAQIERYLENDRALQKMSDKVHAKVIEKHESRKRFAGIVEFIEKNLNNKQHERKVNNLSASEKCIRRGEVYYYTFFRSVASGYRFTNKDNREFLKLAVEEFKRASAYESTPRSVTSLAVAEASFNFLFNKDEMTENKWSGIISMLGEVISSCPLYMMAHYHLGLLHFRLGNRKEALKIFNKAIELFMDKSSNLDPWCLQTYDFDLFDSLIQKPLNENLLLLFTEEEGAIKKISNLYQAAILYYVFIIEKERGDIYKALEAVLESSNLNPECGLIARKASEMLALLGFEEESLIMYKKAIEILPLDIELRAEYINVLYLYKKDREALNEIKKALKIIKRASMFTEKSVNIKDMIAKFTRLDPSLPYSHDTGKENLLYQWIDSLYDSLRKYPKNPDLVLRIIEIWNELEREDKVFEIIEEYIANCKKRNQLDNTNISLVENIYDYLKRISDIKNKKSIERLDGLKGFINDMQSVATN